MTVFENFDDEIRGISTNFRRLLTINNFREYSRLGNDVDLKVYNQRTIIVLGGTICAIILTFIELIVRLTVVYKQFVPVVFLPLFLYAKVQLTIIFILRRTKALRIVALK